MKMFEEESRLRGGGAKDSQWDSGVLGVRGKQVTVFYVFYGRNSFLPNGRPETIVLCTYHRSSCPRHLAYCLLGERRKHCFLRFLVTRI